LLVILVLVLTSSNAQPVGAANQSSAEQLLLAMSAEEKVGQLFLVTFDGMEVDEDTEIYNLITDYHIGGVVLLAKNENFPQEDVVAQTKKMIKALQQQEWASSEELGIDELGDQISASYVPLFIGLEQIGNGYPGDEILTGLTPLPSHMAIGATWDLDLANRVGEVAGSELSALGVNLFLGPNLDVLENSTSEAGKSLGVSTFGGDPFWVGEMGKAYISGLHAGSKNRMLVVAQNFPGTGNSDRSPEFEVATVRKSLEQLKQIELAPYFSVTTPPVGDPGRVDAVMVSHIRYQGFQGNIRATTRPISFDSSAFQQIMSLPQFADWRETGGLIISDNLGSGSVRRFFDPDETNFDAKQIARSAFLAGNDVLYVDDFIASGDPDSYTTIISTLNFFIQKYREDSAFSKRVDSSVLRILDAKLQLYGDFSLTNVNNSGQPAEGFGQSEEVTLDIAQNAVTLIDPSDQELDSLLTAPPLWYENIVIFTDARAVRQCEGCPALVDVNTNAFANALVRLYGPQAGGQILQHNLASYTFSQLAALLDNIENSSSEFLPANLRSADWVVFNILDIDPDYPESNALQRILSERPDLLTNKNVIVFSLDSPLYLDATDISKITAYYALYSKAPVFLDVAARVLMQEIVPQGSLPVSLNAVGYDLISMMAPDPNQLINLNLVLPEPEETKEPEGELEETQTPVPTPMPSFKVGDTLTIRTGQIHDHNQNVVPDGTIVRFNFRISGEPGVTQQFDTSTSGGVAYFNYRIESPGGLEISAISEPAMQSETLQINISSEGVTSILAITPTPLVSPTPTEEPTATPTDIPSPTSTPEPVRNSYPSLGEWALGVMVIAVGGAMAYLVGYLWWGSARWGLRSGLCALIGGLLAYAYLNLGFTGTQFWMVQSGTTFVVEVVAVGILLGWIGALIWWMRTDGRRPNHRNRQR